MFSTPETRALPLTNYVLNDHLDCPQGHVSTWYLVRRASTPLIWWDRLEEVLDRREQFHRVQDTLLEILRNVPRQLPDTLQHQLRNLGFLGVNVSPVGRERLDDPQQEREQCTARGCSVISDGAEKKTYRNMDILLPVANSRKMIMLMNRERSLTLVS